MTVRFLNGTKQRWPMLVSETIGLNCLLLLLLCYQSRTVAATSLFEESLDQVAPMVFVEAGAEVALLPRGSRPEDFAWIPYENALGERFECAIPSDDGGVSPTNDGDVVWEAYAQGIAPPRRLSVADPIMAAIRAELGGPEACLRERRSAVSGHAGQLLELCVDRYFRVSNPPSRPSSYPILGGTFAGRAMLWKQQTTGAPVDDPTMREYYYMGRVLDKDGSDRKIELVPGIGAVMSMVNGDACNATTSSGQRAPSLFSTTVTFRCQRGVRTSTASNAWQWHLHFFPCAAYVTVLVDAVCPFVDPATSGDPSLKPSTICRRV